MREPSATQRLVDHLMEGQLEEFVRSRRAKHRAWRRIALDIRDETGVDITYETLRNWFPETDDHAASPVEAAS